MNCSVMLFLSLGLGASGAFADVVFLRNGGRLEGATSVDGDRLVIRLESGTVKIPRADVLRIVPAPLQADEYAKRTSALAGSDAKGHWELALWCANEGLSRSARVELETVIAIDPDHAAAREKLGYEKVEGRWLRGTELLEAKGMVKVDGVWVTREESAAIAAAKKVRGEERLAAAERARSARIAREEAQAREAAESNASLRTTWTYPTNRYRSYGYRYYGYRGGYSYRYGRYGAGYGRTSTVTPGYGGHHSGGHFGGGGLYGGGHPGGAHAGGGFGH